MLEVFFNIQILQTL